MAAANGGRSSTWLFVFRRTQEREQLICATVFRCSTASYAVAVGCSSYRSGVLNRAQGGERRPAMGNLIAGELAVDTQIHESQNRESSVEILLRFLVNVNIVKNGRYSEIKLQRARQSATKVAG